MSNPDMAHFQQLLDEGWILMKALPEPQWARLRKSTGTLLPTSQALQASRDEQSQDSIVYQVSDNFGLIRQSPDMSLVYEKPAPIGARLYEVQGDRKEIKFTMTESGWVPYAD